MLDAGPGTAEAVSGSNSPLLTFAAFLMIIGLIALLWSLWLGKRKRTSDPVWVSRFKEIFKHQALIGRGHGLPHFWYISKPSVLTFYLNGVLVWWAQSGLCVSIAENPDCPAPLGDQKLRISQWFIVADSVSHQWTNGPWNPAVETALVAVECTIADLLMGTAAAAQKAQTKEWKEAQKSKLEKYYQAWSPPEEAQDDK